MAVQPWENALLKKVGESGNDGETDNDKRTLAFYVGGHDFSIVLVDSDVVQNDVKVHVNNANAIDPNAAYHAVHPQSLGVQSVAQVLVDAGAFGGVNNVEKESSASASDFADNWIDYPNATIDQSVSAYQSSGSWRWMRLVTTSEMNATLSAYAWSRQISPDF